jgi:radical SAM superfamily enzyme YgiQ (UPF0313 family)
MKKQVLLINIPLTEIKRPAPAVYHLKGQLEAGGVTCYAYDANIALYNIMKDTWSGIERMLDFGHRNFAEYAELYESTKDNLNQLIGKKIDEVDPDWIGVSIFSMNSNLIGEDVLKYIRQHYPNKKIVIGGTGLGEALGDTNFDYAKTMHKAGLCDYWIAGEGEVAIVDLICKNNPNAAGINRAPKQILNLEGLAFANYEDCEHELYPFKDYDYGVPTYVLTGSRGCVRRCDFCDIYRLWPKFKTRGGEHIAKEIIYHYEQRGVNCFYMSDSLVNGSMKAFRDLYTTLLGYQETHNMTFTWGGQFIARTNSQMSLEDYILARKSGFRNAGWGLEHASENIRKAMRKGFDNQAVDDTLNNLSAAGINTMINFLFGHPLETEEDFFDNIRFLYKYKKFNDDGTIASLNLQQYLVFLPGTDFHDAKDDMVESEGNTGFWKAKETLNTLTFQEVYYRRKKISEICEDLGWRTYNEEVFMGNMERDYMYYKHKKSFEKNLGPEISLEEHEQRANEFIKNLKIELGYD